MKNFDKKIIFLILICVISNVVFIFMGKNTSAFEEFEYEILSKNMKDATDFDINNNGEIFIAKKGKVIKIDKYGQEILIFEDESLKINQIAVNDNSLFYLYDDKLNSYNLLDNKHTKIIDNIPNYGVNWNNKLLLKDNNLYLSIGSATNSGIVEGNEEFSKNGKCDLASKEIVLSGENYGIKNTGPFKVFGQSANENEVINENVIPNATLLKISKDTGEFKIVAHGIRNIEGFDFSSEGIIYFSAGGIEDKGIRPLAGDSDYLYELKENAFYGWPDYSGGDRVDSSRFRFEGKEKINPVTKISDVPQRPFYQHDNVNSLGSITIDREGKIKNKDSIFVSDRINNTLFNIDKFGKKTFVLNNVFLDKIKIHDDKILALETKTGNLISISSNSSYSTFIFNSIIFKVLLGFGFMITIIIVSYVLKMKK